MGRNARMYYGAIKDCDIANGDGTRVSLFVSGCTNHCEGCFQPETWDFHHGQLYTEQTEEHILSLLSKSYINGLSILGGDPMEPKNQPCICALLEQVRARYGQEKDIWIYTGFTLERLLADGDYCRTVETDRILDRTDILVDGPFILAKKNIGLRFRGSENQRLLDLNAWRRTGELICLPDRERRIYKQK